jgi:hypothetical protein
MKGLETQLTHIHPRSALADSIRYPMSREAPLGGSAMTGASHHA